MNNDFSNKTTLLYNFTDRIVNPSSTVSLPILTFHAFDERPSVISFSARVFRQGMAKLHESGYRSVFDEAFPVLQKYGMSATVFLTVGERRTPKLADRLPSLEGRSMLSWQEIIEMQRLGIDFGTHTLTHPDLTRVPFERVEAEICESKAIIEDALSAQVNSFAYPYGCYDRRSREIVRKHFVCACSDKLGLTDISNDLYSLKRIEAYYIRTDRLFDLMLTSFFPWYIQMRRIPREIRRAFQVS